MHRPYPYSHCGRTPTEPCKPSPTSRGLDSLRQREGRIGGDEQGETRQCNQSKIETNQIRTDNMHMPVIGGEVSICSSSKVAYGRDRLRPSVSRRGSKQCHSSARGLKLRLRYKIISLKPSASGLYRDPVFLRMYREDFGKPASESGLRDRGHRDA